jgi:phage baseplate assembly protein W
MPGYSPFITPYEPDPETGFSQCRNLAQVARQNLLMIILTQPGERIWDSSFGVGLKRYLFENDVPPLRQRLKESIKSQAGRYIPWVNINSVDFSSSNPEQNLLSIMVNYTIKPTATSETLSIQAGISDTGTPSIRFATIDSFNRATEIRSSASGLMNPASGKI